MLVAHDTVAAEMNGWRDSIVVGSQTQDHALYRPGQVMHLACTLALLEAGVAEPDPLTLKRIEVIVDRFAEDDCYRACSAVDATPHLFAGGRGLLQDWTSGRNAVGGLAPDEWAEHGIAVVWWRPHREDLRYLYVEKDTETPLGLGEQTNDKWEIAYRPVYGPPIPNNHCDPPLWVRPQWPWTHAADRQLALLDAGGAPCPTSRID